MIKNILLCVFLGCLLVGCSSGGDAPPLTADQQKQATDLDTIVKKANGNYDSLSDADKKNLINIAGSEQGARMMIASRGRGHGTPGGPPGGQ